MTTRVPSTLMDMSAGVSAAAFTPPVAVAFSATTVLASGTLNVYAVDEY